MLVNAVNAADNQHEKRNWMKLEIEKLREKMNYYKNDPFKELSFFSSPGLKSKIQSKTKALFSIW